ncbi:MAG: dipicolinate synthase subunit B [Firmicutes bacterium]|nr:dipicolinate synthase subunit B [Bacillota bacterium]
MLSGKKIGYCLCGSFCTINAALGQIEVLKGMGADIIPILSESVQTTKCRFCTPTGIIDRLQLLCDHAPITDIVAAEPIGPQNNIDVMVVAPCTSNMLGKLANGINDCVATMACKAHLRNSKPLVLAAATNDALGVSLKNIGELIVRKNVYIVPFGQDDPINKPLSMVADFNKVADTVLLALEGRQLQPIII